MNVTVLLFAQVREAAGASRLDLVVEEGSSIAAVFEVISARSPGIAVLRDSLRCAIGDEYTDWDAPVPDGAEVAFIPPTAGG